MRRQCTRTTGKLTFKSSSPNRLGRKASPFILKGGLWTSTNIPPANLAKAMDPRVAALFHHTIMGLSNGNVDRSFRGA